MSELNPCPFCGAKARRADCIGCGYVQIICPECGANISITLRSKDDPKLIGMDETELIKRWNKRT